MSICLVYLQEAKSGPDACSAGWFVFLLFCRANPARWQIAGN
jgi:hypothetical protein